MKSLVVERAPIPCIEAMRFFAAFLVVLHHAPLINLKYGNYGVDLFFIISGFVMMYSTELSARNFFAKRVIRILPIYWAATLALFAIALAERSLLKSTDANVTHLVKSLFFIPFDKNGTGHFPVLSVGWSLNLEMYFYLVFGLSMKLSRKYRDAITACVIATVYLISNTLLLDYPLKAYGEPMVFEFVLGLLAYRLLTWDRGQHVAALLTGIALLVPAFLYADLALERLLPIGLPIFIVFMCIVFAMKQREIPQVLVVLGGSSYALYLVHLYILAIVSAIIGHIVSNPAVLMVGSLAASLISVIASVLIFQVFEKPVTRWLRRNLLASRLPERSTASKPE